MADIQRNPSIDGEYKIAVPVKKRIYPECLSGCGKVNLSAVAWLTGHEYLPHV
jgi:hypothetical protein